MTKAELRYIENCRKPLWFIQECLKVDNLTNKQKEIVESVWENKYTLVPSGHNVGKTFIAGCIALAYTVPYENTQTITTAPTARQVEKLLWSEIAMLYNRASFYMGRLTKLELVCGDKWNVQGITTSAGKEESSAVKFQGYHSGRILVIIDEACGVHPAVWEAIDGVASNDDARILAIGNPSMINVPFHIKSRNPKWNVIRLSSLDHPNIVTGKEVIKGAIGRTWVQDKIDDWCVEVPEHDREKGTFEYEGKIYVPNNLFRWKVLGLFPSESEFGLITLKSIEEAMNRDYVEMDDAWCNLAVDVARFGDDKSIITIDQGRNITQYKFQGLDVVEVAEKVAQFIVLYQPLKVGVDADGLGSGVFDILKSKRDKKEIRDEDGKEIIVQLVEIHGGSRQVDRIAGKKVTTRFKNLRSQMYWQLRLDMHKLSIPNDQQLKEQLTAVDYNTPNGIVFVLPKDEIKSVIGYSPDEMDSLVYCNWLKYVREKVIRAGVRI